MHKKRLTVGIIIVVIIAILAWAFWASTRPLPGVEQLQSGRDHKPEGSKLEYKFNPPTSGDHYPSWITKGFYDEPRPDGNLVHSLEHGYIIFWYDCEKKLGWNLIPQAYAQSMQMTEGSEGTPSASLAQLPKAFSDGSCTIKDSIKQIMNENMHKLIAVPRVGMDAPLILTAWGRSEKFNTFSKSKIEEFINAFRDNGPEQTVEP